MSTPGVNPPTNPVNHKIQCAREGCATMLLTDGTCPRCDPPNRRTTADKIRISEAYKDPKLRRLAEAEIHAGIATGLPNLDADDEAERFASRPAQLQQRPGAPRSVAANNANDLDDVHARIDRVEARIDNGFAEMLDLLRDKLGARPATPPADTTTPAAPATPKP